MADKRSRKEIEAEIIARAWKDQRFKALLLKNPRAAFKEIGVDIAENIQIQVVEDKPNTFSFVLPPAAAGAETMSDAELEKLAGGALFRGYETGYACMTSPCEPKS